MFKSRARREAERQLKIQQEKENILAEQQRRQERSAQQQQRAQALLRSIGLWYGNLSTRNKVIVAVGGVILIAALGQTGSTQNTATTTPDEPAIASSEVVPSPATTSSEAIVSTSAPEAPSPIAASPKVLSEAEQFKEVVVANTDGLLAIDRVQNMPPEELYAWREGLADTISQGVSNGVPLANLKQMFADQLQIQHGFDEKLAANLADGLIDGILAWERGEHSSGTVEASTDFIDEQPVATASTPAVGQIGRLAADDPNARINLRDEPNANTPTNRYGLEGDRVVLQDTTSDSDGYTWHKVQFQQSGAIGWIRADFVEF